MVREWSKEDVKRRFEKAAYTLRRLPPVKVQGYFNLMPEVMHSEEEKREHEVLPMRVRPTPDAISRMEEVFEWVCWVHDPDDRHLIWWRAERLPWKIICQRTGACRTTLTARHNAALNLIATRLNILEEMNEHERTK